MITKYLLGAIRFFERYLPWVALLFISNIFSLLANGQDSIPKTASIPQKIFYGQASFYSNKFNGRKTANGEIFSQQKMTCASNVVKLGNWLRVTNLKNNKTVIVKVNDRMHPSMRRVVDLSFAAAAKLGFIEQGLARVRVEVLGKRKPI